MNPVRRSAQRFAAVAMLAGLAFPAAAQIPACPARLAVQQLASAAPEGWKAYDTNREHPLVGISFSEGTPDRKFTLAPERDRKTGRDAVTSSWVFGTSTEGYWVACLYADTSVVIAQKLPAGVTGCEATYDTRHQPAIVRQWTCKEAPRR